MIQNSIHAYLLRIERDMWATAEAKQNVTSVPPPVLWGVLLSVSRGIKVGKSGHCVGLRRAGFNVVEIIP